jgi:hypothetical protein
MSLISLNTLRCEPQIASIDPHAAHVYARLSIITSCTAPHGLPQVDGDTLEVTTSLVAIYSFCRLLLEAPCDFLVGVAGDDTGIVLPVTDEDRVLCLGPCQDVVVNIFIGFPLVGMEDLRCPVFGSEKLMPLQQ